MKKLVVFISHITEEKEIAAALKKLVEQTFLNMIEVFVSSDSTSIKPGRRWMDEITLGLKTCAVEIVLASPESVKRPWINFEAGAGWIRDIPVIPLCHSGMTPSKLPVPLSNLQAGTATVESDLKMIFPLLAKSLGSAEPKADFSEFIEAVKQFEETSKQISAMAQVTPVAPAGGLTAHELATLVEIANKTAAPGDAVSVNLVRNDLENGGLRGIAITLGLKMLARKDFIEFRTDHDWNNNEYTTVVVADKGFEWLEAHVDLLSLTDEPAEPKPSARPKGSAKSPKSAEQFTEDDLPF